MPVTLTQDQINDLMSKGLTKDEITTLSQNNGRFPRSNILNKPVETIFRSGGDVLKSAFQAISHPIKTGKALLQTAVGAAESLPFVRDLGPETPSTQQFDRVKEFFQRRYGSLEAVKNTALEDPVGFALDLSVVLGGAGAATKALGGVTKSSELARAGTAIGRAGEIVDPFAMIGRGIGKITQKAGEVVKNPLRNNLAEDAAKIDQLAKAREIDLPSSALTDAKAVQAAEALAARGLFGQSVVEKFSKAIEVLRKEASDIVEGFGGARRNVDVGTEAIQAAQNFKQRFIATKENLFTDLDQSAIKIKTTDTKPAVEFLNSVLEKKEAALKILPEGSVVEVKLLKTIRDNLQNAKEITAADVTSTIRELRRKMSDRDFVAVADEAVLKKLSATLDEIRDKAVLKQNPELSEAIKAANDFYKENLKIMLSKSGNVIKRAMDSGNPEIIAPALLRPGLLMESELPRIRKMVGPQAYEALKANLVQNIFKKATTAKGGFSATKLEHALALYGEGTLKKFLGPETFQHIQEITKLSKALERGAKIAEGSQTAYIGRIATEAVLLFTNPLLAVKVIVGDVLFSKFLASQAGKKFLTGQTKFNAPRIPGNIKIPVQKGIGPAFEAGQIEQAGENEGL